MKATEAITNLHTDDVERAREFFRFLGLTEEPMTGLGGPVQLP